MRFVLKKTIGTIALYVNKELITSKSYRSIEDRREIMNHWTKAFLPFQQDLIYFHLSHSYCKKEGQERELKKLSLEPKRGIPKVNKRTQKVQTGIPKASFLIRNRSSKKSHA